MTVLAGITASIAGRGNTLIQIVALQTGHRPRAASIYTLVATARLNGLNPENYLKDILAKITDEHTINRIDELVPWRMIRAAATSSP